MTGVDRSIVPGGEPLRVLGRGIYRGPNIFSLRPMIRIRVALGALEAWPTSRLPGFSERLLGLLPGLANHGCSCRDTGGFARRLADGTWLGHVIEHVALELQAAAGVAVSRGKTRSVTGQPGVYDIVYAYGDETLGLAAGGAAIRLVMALLPEGLDRWEGDGHLPPPLADQPTDGKALVEALAVMHRRSALGPTTGALVSAAERRNIPVTRLDAQGLVLLGYGSRQQRLRASISGRTPQIAVAIAGNKDATKGLLEAAGLPVPTGIVARSLEDALAGAERLGKPVVVKPLDGNHGKGVSTALVTDDQVAAAFTHAAKVSARVIVERHLPGNDHRILVIGGKMVAVAERVPAMVTGDGLHSIKALIGFLNEDPRRGDGHENVLTRIRMDAALLDMLARQGKTPASVPPAGERVMLRGAANLSSGGTAVDRTDEIHPENRLIAEMAARTIGLDIAGVDFLSPDISRPVGETGGGIVEVNAAPGFRMHLAPSHGTPRDVAAPVIDMLFPPGAPSRIPIIAVTGTNGKSTTVRMVAAILRHAGRSVGLTTTSGVYLNDLLLKRGDASGPKSAKMILRNPAADVAVLETARGGIVREGLGFDRCAVGAVLNIAEDHLGVGGVDSLEQLAAIKSVVVRSVARRGAAVLNFDDPRTRAMARLSRGRIIWFSLDASADDPRLAAHLSRGGAAVLRESGEAGGLLVLRQGERRVPIAAAADIPATMGGVVPFNIANALAAAAMASALGIGVEAIAAGLRAFASDYRDNPGRFNIIDDHPFRVVIDYAHNVASMRAIAACLDDLRTGRGRAIGMVSMPGDRRDADIFEMGAVSAAMFDHIVFREGPDGRGRPRGDVMRLLGEGARGAGAGDDKLSFVLEEKDAVAHCLNMARAGDLLLLFPTRIEQVHEQVRAFRPAPAVASTEAQHVGA